jgi:hypothetical protein
MMTYDEEDKLNEELSRLRQFHADIVLARQRWWAGDCTTEVDNNFIEAIYRALLKHNPDFGLLKRISHD